MLLLFPGVVLFQVTGEVGSERGRLVLGIGLLALQLFTYFQTRSDKRKARDEELRTPESVLHALEFFGGWPAGFVAQRRFRHKTAKKEYQAIFWLIVLSHQLLALSFLFRERLGLAALFDRMFALV